MERAMAPWAAHQHATCRDFLWAVFRYFQFFRYAVVGGLGPGI